MFVCLLCVYVCIFRLACYWCKLYGMQSIVFFALNIVCICEIQDIHSCYSVYSPSITSKFPLFNFTFQLANHSNHNHRNFILCSQLFSPLFVFYFLLLSLWIMRKLREAYWYCEADSVLLLNFFKCKLQIILSSWRLFPQCVVRCYRLIIATLHV